MMRFFRYVSCMTMIPLMLFAGASAQSEGVPDPDEILRAVEGNMNSETQVVESKMVIRGRRGSRTVESRSWIEGNEKAFTEYTAPARERGTKMLKLGDMLWTYSPQTDRVIQISGHMLRQSVMGSDLSYEDMMENHKLRDAYAAEVTGSEEMLGRECWVLSLTGKEEGLAYQSRKIWVDVERMIPLREERYARSGKLIKSTEIREVMHVGERWYPKVIVFKDELKSNSKGTEWIVEKIEFDVRISESTFSKAVLRK